MLFTLLLTYLLPSQPIDPYISITNQANTYIEYIKLDTQKDLSFWALNELYSSSCEVNKNVSRAIGQSASSFLQRIFSDFECTTKENEDSLKFERLEYYAIETGSFSTLINILSLTRPKGKLNSTYSKFLDRWQQSLSSDQIQLAEAVKDRNNISLTEINTESKLFILYSLLFSEFVNNYFTADEFTIIITYLNNTQQTDITDFDRSILNFNLVKAAYETNRYILISNKFNELIASELYPHSEKKVGVFSGLDFALSYIGNYSESLYLQRNILIPLSRYYDQKSRTDFVLLQQSANLYNLGKYEDAKQILEDLYNDPNSTIPKSQLYNNLSLCYKQLGQKNEYTQFLLRAIQQAENEKKPDDNFYKVKLGLYQNLFVYYNSIGDSTSAMPYIRKAQNLAELNNDQFELGSIHFYLGDYYLERFNDFDKALIQFNIAQTLFTSSQNYLNNKLLLSKKIELLIEIDSLQEAQKTIQEVKNIASESSDTPQYLEALIFEGNIAVKQNNLDKIQSVIDEIKVYSLEDLEFEVLVRYFNLQATLFYKKSLYREAYVYLKPTLNQIIERAKGSVESETGFWSVKKEYLDSFELMMSILKKLDYTAESIVFLDKLKTINDASLYNNPLLKASKLSEKELAEEKKLIARIQNLRTEYLSADENSKQALKTEIDKLSAQRQLLTNKVIKSSPESDLPIWKVQQQMNTEELILHYTELNNKLYVSSISKQNLDLYIIDITNDIDLALKEAANGLAAGKTSLSSLFKVYNLLRLKNIPEGITQITVIPDNELYRIPLDVLPTEKPNSAHSFGSANYMIEDYSFKYFTSLKDYLENNRNAQGNLETDFSAFAISYFDDFPETLPSLPFATQEAREIQRVLTSFEDKKVFTGNGATEQAFQTQLNTSKILHVATHSEVSSRDPLFSTIYLKSAESKGTEGNALYAYELFDNQLENDLIMLNSCSSGTGSYLQGTGIMGISRALRYAGAKSLALNLWEVNDKIAADFATNFYAHINQGYSKSDAMRLAKINHIKTGSADPHYWGAYTLIGNSNPIIKKPASSQFVLPLLITVGLLVGFKVRKKSIE
jgi:CHAT domain-containing protein/tetratricopeptide (TPR) repeat protein